MISADDAKMGRIIGFDAQILRALGCANAVLLQVLFNDSRLISVGKYRDSGNSITGGDKVRQP